MKIDSLKELEAVLKLCHKQGVHSITIDGITMSIGELPETAQKLKTEESPRTLDAYSDEDVLLWSSEPRVG